MKYIIKQPDKKHFEQAMHEEMTGLPTKYEREYPEVQCMINTTY